MSSLVRLVVSPAWVIVLAVSADCGAPAARAPSVTGAKPTRPEHALHLLKLVPGTQDHAAWVLAPSRHPYRGIALEVAWG